ncbi:MAG: PaaX family transcriptional regulator C-terminal domain-containing protein [Actinomycetes bacterium]
MDARSALFDVYGDHLRTWPGLQRAGTPVAALVRLLEPLGVRPPAVRTAVSRMARAGWLEGVRLPAGPGYALTERAQRRLDEAAKRIYRTTGSEWDGTWHLVVVTPPHDRTEREHLHAALRYLGYGVLAPSTWVAARPAPELDGVLAEAGVPGQRFVATAELSGSDVVAQAWDLASLADGYRRFLSDARRALEDRPTETDADAFAARLRLVHDWRQFLKVDPGLPAALLPADWPGTTAAAWFDEQSARLLPAARAFVASCLAGTADPDPAPEGLLPCPRPSETAPSRSTSRTASPP